MVGIWRVPLKIFLVFGDMLLQAVVDDACRLLPRDVVEDVCQSFCQSKYI